MFHGESLFVVAAGDSEDVSGPFGSEVIGGDLLGHSLLLEVLQLLFIVDFKDLLTPGLWEGDVEFHL